MTTRNWGWYASADGENYTCGPEPTREAIIQAATDDEIGVYDLADPQVFHIVEAWQASINLADRFDAMYWIDRVNDDLCENDSEADDHPMVDLATDAVVGLETAVRAAITKWQADNNLHFHCWSFSGTRNAETITITEGRTK